MNPIVGIHAFRHGAGTSTLTAYLALILAQQGRRVVAIEVQYPGAVQTPRELCLPNYLNVNIPAIAFEAPIDPQAYQTFPVPNFPPNAEGSGQIEVITFPAPITQHWTLETCSQLLGSICQASNADYCLIDLPAGMNEFTLMMFGVLDTLLVLLCPDQSDFQGTAVTTDVAKRLQIPQIAIALNQVPDIFDPESLQHQIEALYQLPFTGYLPFAGEIRLGLPYQTFPRLNGTDDFGRALERLALHLQTLENLPSLPEASPEARPAFAKTPRPTLLDILMLPDAERQLTNWLIYRGQVQTEEVAQHLGTSLSVAQGILDTLLKEGIIERVTQADGVYYQSRIEPPGQS
ncbi:MAG: hypothetical protein ACO3NK_18125 [Prochlorotrichaceae cyanobacterium]|jgi:MinD-like ATPase involved in chromosome partitioning or flagellar assembly